MPQRIVKHARGGKKGGKVTITKIQVSPRAIAGTAAQSVNAVREGVPAEAYVTLRDIFKVSDRQFSRIVRIQPRTLKRRLASGRLQPDESERVTRLGRLLHRAIEVFGQEETALRWFKKPLVALQNETPLDRADTEPGAREVEDLLGRIEHGIPL